MSFLINLGTAILGLTAITVTSLYFSINSSSADNTQNITWTPLSDEIVNNEIYNNSIGKKYSRFLVGTYGTFKSNNKSWWDSSYKLFLNDLIVKDNKPLRRASNEFSHERIGISFKPKLNLVSSKASEPKKSLNEVCNEVYLKDFNSFQTNPNKQLKEDLWRYCSPFRKTPIFVNEKDSSLYKASNNIGKTKEQDLLSTTEESNNIFWDYLQKLFFASSLSTVKDKYFKDLDTTQYSLKKKCAEAYLKPNRENENNNPLDIKVVEYCSLTTLYI